MILATLSAMRRRLLLLVAKATNGAGLASAASLVAVAGCLLVGRLMLPTDGLNSAHGYTLVSIGHSPTLRAAIGSVVYLVLIALLSLGLAAAIRRRRRIHRRRARAALPAPSSPGPSPTRCVGTYSRSLR